MVRIAALFFQLDIGLQVRHRLFHHAGTLYHLGQEHLAGAKQVANDVHAIHQRPFDHLDRAVKLLPCFFGILDDPGGNALDQRVREALFNALLAPAQILDRPSLPPVSR